MLKKFGIPVILCVIVILTGCDQGQKMMKPVLTPESTTVEQPMPDSGADPAPVDATPEDLSFNPQPPEKFDFTGIAGLTEWDRVLEVEDSFLTDNSHLIFNDYVSATQSDVVKAFFKYAERWITNNCRKETHEAINVQTLFFTSRDSRIEFVQKALGYPDYAESEPMPLPEDLWWSWHSVNVSVVDETPYFELQFHVNYSHPECRP